jgi:WD40 repeat protein
MRCGRVVLSLLFSVAITPSAAVSGAEKADRFGDPLPPGAIARLGTIRFRHSGWIRALALAPGGKVVASADDNSIRLWEVATGKELRRLEGHEGRIYSLAFSPDGKTLASGGQGAAGHAPTIFLWNVMTGEEIRRLKLPLYDAARRAGRYVGPIVALAFARERNILASAQENSVLLWDVGTGEQLRRFAPREQLAAVAMSPDGKLLATGSRESTVRLWELSTGKELRKLDGHRGQVATLAFTADSHTLASAGDDQAVRLWDVETGKGVREIKGHEGIVTSLAFSADGKTITSGSYDRTIRSWETATGKEIRRIDGCNQFSRSGDLLACAAENTIRLVDLTRAKEATLEAHEGTVYAVAFSPDGKRLASGSEDRSTRLWELATGKEIRRVGHLDRVTRVVFSTDAALLAEGVGSTLCVSDAARDRQVQEARLPNLIHSFAFSPDSRAVLVQLADGTIRRHDLARPREAPSPVKVDGLAYALALSPDGKIVGGAGNHVVSIWNATGKEILRLKKYQEATTIWAAGFSLDGKTLALATNDHSLDLWETATGKEIAQLKGHSCIVTRIAFSPDGMTLASAAERENQDIRLWDVATGKQLRRLAGHPGSVMSLAFSPDGKTLASGSADTTVLLWDVRDITQRRPARRLADKELNDLWIALVNNDAGTGYRAIAALGEAPQDAVPYLGRQLQPGTPADQKRLNRLIADLDSDTPAVRRDAKQALEALGRRAEPALRQALTGEPSLEVRRTVERLLASLEAASAERVRETRAIQALELACTPEAKQVLTRLARESSSQQLRTDAETALARMARRLAR